MHIRLAKSSGFCFGVDHAVRAAYDCLENLQRKMPTYMLGAITHNEYVVSDLLSKGIILAENAEDILPDSTVLIRTHGVSPKIREILSAKNCDVIDCTCPYVEKIHRIVKNADAEGKSVIISGTKGHPEVTGICGESNGDIHVIGSADELENLGLENKDWILVSQTTFSAEEFDNIR